MDLGAEAQQAPPLQQVPVGSVAEQGSQEGHCSHWICAHRVKGSGGCWASLSTGFLPICSWCLKRAGTDKASEKPRKKTPAHVQDALRARFVCVHPENFPGNSICGSVSMSSACHPNGYARLEPTAFHRSLAGGEAAAHR